MAQTYPKTFRNCSTCNSWEGQRKVDASRSNIIIDSLSASGKCEHQKGHEQVAYMTCPDWSELCN
ncbi:MAG: hypothetical protein JKX98_06880 [Alcanivoracaceae bacterium]|nr:hypothetical protein [Alcanivoracaceae bacterium]